MPRSGQIRFLDGTTADVEMEVETKGGSLGRITSFAKVECSDTIRPIVHMLVGKIINLQNGEIFRNPQPNANFTESANNRSP